MKYLEKLELFEQIISLFSTSTNGLSTDEIYDAMRNEYTYNKTKRSLIRYIDKLAEGYIDDVRLIKQNRGKHTIKDMRVCNKETLQKEQEKMRQKEQLQHDEKVYMRLAVESIKGMSNLSSKFHKDIEKRLKLHDLESTYFIESEKLEPVNRDDYDFRQLKSAIRNKNIIGFNYQAKSSRDFYVIEPYKLIISNSLWYLYGKDTEESNGNPYKTWRVKYIRDVELDNGSNHAVSNEEIEEVLSKIHSPYFVKGQEIHVQVKVDAEVAEEFDPYAHLPGAYGEPEKQSDGSVILNATVSSLKEIEREIKMWLPNIKVLKPQKMQQRLLDELSRYLSVHNTTAQMSG